MARRDPVTRMCELFWVNLECVVVHNNRSYSMVTNHPELITRCLWCIIPRIAVTELRLRIQFEPESRHCWKENCIHRPEAGSLCILLSDGENVSQKIVSFTDRKLRISCSQILFDHLDGRLSFLPIMNKAIQVESTQIRQG